MLAYPLVATAERRQTYARFALNYNLVRTDAGALSLINNSKAVGISNRNSMHMQLCQMYTICSSRMLFCSFLETYTIRPHVPHSA